MLVCQKDQFRLAPDGHYLNLAYMAPLHSHVLAAGEVSLQRQSQPQQLGVDAMFSEVHALRSQFASLTGVREPDRVALAPSASYGIATAAKNLRVGADQNVVVIGDQFPSNYYAWSRSCGDSGAELRIVAPPRIITDGTSRAARWNQRLLEAIDSDTAVVALPMPTGLTEPCST